MSYANFQVLTHTPQLLAHLFMLFALAQTPQFALYAYCLWSCKCGTMERWQGDLVF